MAITSAVCKSLKEELLRGIHDLDTLYCRINDSSGSVAERVIKIRIKEQ